MRKFQELKSKSGKNISFLIEEMSSTPNLTLIESPGGLVETKEKTAERRRLTLRNQPAKSRFCSATSGT